MTSVNVDQLESELQNHPDKTFVNYLCNGLRQGFDLLLSDTPVNIDTFECKNAKTAIENADVVDGLIADELAKGFIKGPFLTAPFENYRVSPIGIAIHKYSLKKRLIFDLSSPHNKDNITSVNDLIDKDLCSLSYVQVDDAISAIQNSGRGSLLCKTDNSDAFKQIGINPKQWNLFCFKWQNLYYHYVRLPFGCRSSPCIFDNLSKSICWIAHNNYGINTIFHLLDDFLTVDSPSDCGERTMALLTLIFNKLNIPLSVKKTVGPTCELEYLGIVLETLKMEARLQREKIDRIVKMISLSLNKQSLTRKELEQLLGHLNFATRVILPGRAFVTYLYKLMCSVKESSFMLNLTLNVRLIYKCGYNS